MLLAFERLLYAITRDLGHAKRTLVLRSATIASFEKLPACHQRERLEQRRKERPLLRGDQRSA
jgi:hypothetical protein